MSVSKIIRSHWWSIFFVLFFPLLIMYIYSDFIRGAELNSRMGWLILLGGIAYLMRHTVAQKILLGIIFLFAMSGSLDLLYAVTFGGVFSNSTLEAVALTDASEAFEFLQAYSSFENILILLLYWLIAFYSLKRILFKEPELIREKVFAVLAVLLIVVLAQQINQRGRAFDAIPGFTGVALDYVGDHQSLDKHIHSRISLYEHSQFRATPKSKEPQTYIVVIGESLNRNHMSLYGYNRDTTPQLNYYSDGIVKFENAISPFAQTKPSLSVNLTENDTVNNRKLSDSLSLIGVFKRAGYRTFWISNQEPLKVPTKPFAMIADEQHFVSNDFHGVDVRRYDGYLLPKIEAALGDGSGKKVIFVHLMGSHLQYANRFPIDRTIFQGNLGVKAYTQNLTSTQLAYINAYDNSVHYTDFILGEVLARLEQVEGVAGLIFWSDHGEEIFDEKDFKGHGPDGVTKSMLEIPFIFWRNEKYIKTFGDVDASLRKHVTARIMLDDFFHIAQCMIPVDSDLLDVEKSLCSAKYHEKPRIVYGKSYDKGLK